MSNKRRVWDTSVSLNQDVSLNKEWNTIRDDAPDKSSRLSVDSQDTGEGHTEEESNKKKSGGQYDADFCVVQDPNQISFETIISELLQESLINVQYDPNTCHDLSHDLAAQIMEKIKELRLRRYKYVAIVSIGSQNERSAMHFGSRCLWDQDVDSFATVKFANCSLFAVAMIYGLHFE